MALNQICLHQQAYCCLVIAIGARVPPSTGWVALRRSDHHLQYISVYYAAAECIMLAYNRYRVPLCGPRTSVGTGKHRDRMQRNSPRQFVPHPVLYRFLSNIRNSYCHLLTRKRNESFFFLFLSKSVCLLTLYRSGGIAIVRHL